MFLSRGDRDLGVAFQTHPGRQAFISSGSKEPRSALESDDTQMTLFTANGLLVGTTRGKLRGIMAPYPSYIAMSYKDWYRTQKERYPLDKENPFACSWLVDIPQLFHRRAPGITCLSAIRAGANGSIKEPVNNSKGCGGVMRVAPVGLYFEDTGEAGARFDLIGAEAAAITHGHALGYIPAATLTHIIRQLAHGDVSVDAAVRSALSATAELFKEEKELPYYLQLMDKAVALAGEDISDLEAIHQLGEGWVADEALAIAVYCALKYPEDIDKALIASVNHKGDYPGRDGLTRSSLIPGQRSEDWPGSYSCDGG